MPVMYEIEYLPEKLVAEFAGSRGNYYEFADGGHIDISTEPVWCYRCGKITHGESIEPLTEIENQLTELLDPCSERCRELLAPYLPDREEVGQAFLREWIEKMKHRYQWRAERRSPPKCIRCGSSSILAFDTDRPIPNPAGEGTIEVRVVGLCSTSFNEWFFTPEGERIQRDTKPTHWHHPAHKDQQWMLKKLLPEMFGKVKSGENEGAEDD
jgi:ribosomal protein S27AE